MLQLFRQSSNQALKTLLGTILIKIATGTVATWGSVNIYYFSYLSNNDISIDSKTNSQLILYFLTPTSFVVFFATTLMRKLGHRVLIRTCAFLYAIGPFLLNIWFTKLTLGLFVIFMPITCFTLSAIPVLNCLWSQFPNHLNKISGFAVLSFAIGGVLWNLLFTAIVNPNNSSAHKNGEISLFGQQVSNNIFRANNIIYIASGLLYIIGSLFIVKRLDSGLNSVGSVAQSQRQEHKEPESGEEQTLQNSVPSPSLLQILKTKRFIILFLIKFLMPLYIIFLNLFIKIIYLPIINDDHFLAFCSALSTIAAIIGALFWGFLGDYKRFKTVLLLIVSIDLFVKTIGIFMQSKVGVGFLYFMLGFDDKGILTIYGPGLIEIFGLEMATQLIPFKSLALFFAYLAVPIVQLTMSQTLSYQYILVVFLSGSLLAFILALYFYLRIHYPRYGEPSPAQIELQSNKSQILSEADR